MNRKATLDKEVELKDVTINNRMKDSAPITRDRHIRGSPRTQGDDAKKKKDRDLAPELVELLQMSASKQSPFVTDVDNDMHSSKDYHVRGMDYTNYAQVKEVCRLAGRTLITSEDQYNDILLQSGKPSHSIIQVKDLEDVECTVRIDNLNSGNSKVLDKSTLDDIYITQMQEKRPKGAATTNLVSSFIHHIIISTISYLIYSIFYIG